MQIFITVARHIVSMQSSCPMHYLRIAEQKHHGLVLHSWFQQYLLQIFTPFRYTVVLGQLNLKAFVLRPKIILNLRTTNHWQAPLIRNCSSEPGKWVLSFHPVIGYRVDKIIFPITKRLDKLGLESLHSLCLKRLVQFRRADFPWAS